MRILLVNKYHFLKGGAERAYFDTARILAEKGHEVMFFSMDHPQNELTPWSKYFVPAVDYLEEETSFFEKVQNALSITWNRAATRNLDAMIREKKPDVAHLHNIYHQLSPSLIWVLKRHRIPIVMTLHDYKLASPNYNLFLRNKIWEHASGFRCLRDRCVKDSFLKSLVCVIEKWFHSLIGSYRLIDRFIAPSGFLIAEMKKLGFNRSIEKIPQPLSPFPAHTSKSRGKYLFYFGRLSKEKGVSLLLDAMKERREERLIIAGSGPEEAYLKQIIDDFALTNVELVGFQAGKNLQQYIDGAKAILLPSLWYENMPYSMLETLGAAKITLASRRGGMVERIRDGENGLLFEPDNLGDLLSTIDRLNRLTEEEKNIMEKQALESIGDLQPEIYGTRLETLYRELVTEKNT